MTVPGRGRRTDALPKKLTHLLGVIVGWVGFVWLWLLVATRPWDSQGLVWLIVGSLLVAPLLTGLWVWHNRSLHRRKGERKAVIVADMSYARDWHGRSVHADWSALRRSRLVLISVEGERKLYRGSPTPVADEAAASAPPLAASRPPAPALAATPRSPLH